VIAEKKTVNRRIEQLHKQAGEWQSKAELALSKDREDLARAALIEKSTVNTTVAMLEDELRKLDETLEKLSTEIDQLQAKLSDARARQKTLLMRSSAAQSRVDINQKLHSFSIDSAMNKFEYYERKIDLMEGQVDSMNIKQRGLQDEFAELANQEKIDLELQSIKAKLHKQ
jgi:phage shock protein A